MQDEFDPSNPFGTAEVPIEQAAPPFEADELDDFVETIVDANLVPDINTVITIKTSGGLTRYVPVPDGQLMTTNEALLAAGLTVSGAFQVWLGDAQIAASAVVPAGSTITVVGNVKGGLI